MQLIVGSSGFAPDPTGDAYNAPSDLLAGLWPTYKAATFKGRGRVGRRAPVPSGRQ